MDCAKCHKIIKKSPLSCSLCRRSWHAPCAGVKHGGRGRTRLPDGWLCVECSRAQPGPGARRESQQNDRQSPRAFETSNGQRHDQYSVQQHQPNYEAGYDEDDDRACTLSLVGQTLMEKCESLANENRQRKEENATLAEDLRRLKVKLKNCDQGVRKMRIIPEMQHQKKLDCRLEIRNLLQRPEEDLLAVVLKLFAILLRRGVDGVKCSLGASDLEAYRVANGPPGPKPVGLIFRDKFKRDLLLRLRPPVRWGELVRMLGEPALEGPEAEELIYVNPALTPYFRRLLGICRRVCRRANIKYCWFSDCRILIRYPTDTSPPLEIVTHDDLLDQLPDNMRHIVQSEIASAKAFQDQIYMNKHNSKTGSSQQRRDGGAGAS